MSGLSHYYAARAAEYERIYAKPERQDNLATLAKVVAEYFSAASVLEMACGTGWWTQHAASAARQVTGVDINEEVLDIARAKIYAQTNTRFVCADLYGDVVLDGPFDAALAAHWWSHVDRREQLEFFDALHRRLAPGSRVLLLDNRFVVGSSTPVARIDAHGNTYQVRHLDDGATYEVMKNFPEAGELQATLGALADVVTFVELDYYWYVTYRVR